jgi:hypothetical protein
VFERATDPDVFLAAFPGAEGAPMKQVRERLERLLDTLPASEERAWGSRMLVALGKRAGRDAKPAFGRYLRGASFQRKLTMCEVLSQTNGEWAIEFLSPMLTDKRTIDRAWFSVFPDKLEPRLAIRLCDEAALTISLHNPELRFTMLGQYADLDRQIDAMRQQISRLPSRHPQPPSREK